MATASKAELFPEEIFIREAVKAGRCKLQHFSMRAIGKPPKGYQARVVPLDLGHRDRLFNTLQSGAVPDLHPITLFVATTGSRQAVRIADGWHRWSAYDLLRRDSIPAYVVEAESLATIERETLEYATMCNRLAALGRTKDDIKRAVWMLLEDETWAKRSLVLIARHVGLHDKTARRYYADFFAETGRKPPELIEYVQQGHVKSVSRSKVMDNSESGTRSRLVGRARPVGVNPRSPGVVLVAEANDRPPHSSLDRQEAIAEARRLGDSTPGNGWRRLLWRLADLLEQGGDHHSAPGASAIQS